MREKANKEALIICKIRQHSYIELGDFLFLTAEVVWMITKIELPIVPKSTLKRVLDKMSKNSVSTS